MAEKKLTEIKEIGFNPIKIMDPAGKINLDDFKKEYKHEFEEMRKFIPDHLVEKELNESLAKFVSVKWGLNVQCIGTTSLVVTVQTPHLINLKNGAVSNGKFSFKIYKKETPVKLLVGVNTIDLLGKKVKLTENPDDLPKLAEKALPNSLVFRTERVPAGFTLFKSVTNGTSPFYIFNDPNVQKNTIVTYRLYTSNTEYIEASYWLRAVNPLINSFTGTPDPLQRKVKFNFDVDLATKTQIFKGSSSTPLSYIYEDSSVNDNSSYSYTLKASNDWGKTASKTITVKCLKMAPEAQRPTVSVNPSFVRAYLTWNVASNVSSCSILRESLIGTKVVSSVTINPTYKNGYCYDTSVSKGGNYRYTMTVSNGWGSTKGTSARVLMIANVPSIPSITGLRTDEKGKVTVTFSQSSTATGYRIYRTVDSKETLAGTSSTISFCDNGAVVNEENTYRVVAVNEWGESSKSAAMSIRAYPCADNVIKRKALCIATKGNIRSQYSCREMAKAFQHNGVPAEYVENLSKANLANKLKTCFAGFDADDYPIIMCYGHGNVDYINLLWENGAEKKITYAALKEMLDKVPGHKIVLISACHSGSAVAPTSATKSLKSAVTEAFSESEFMANIKKVFSAKAVTANTSTSMRAALKSAEMATSDYSVICSASPDESSYGTTDNNAYGYIPHFWCKGIGWEFLASSESDKPSWHYADTNGNGEITVAELTEYTRVMEMNRPSKTSKRSNPFCWPENDNRVIVNYTKDCGGIRYFKLTNKGAFFVKLCVEITDPITGAQSSWSATGNFAVNKSKTVDLSSQNLKPGTIVKLKVVVMAGKDKTSQEFYYNPESTQTASFTISGTTLNNKLKQV